MFWPVSFTFCRSRLPWTFSPARVSSGSSGSLLQGSGFAVELLPPCAGAELALSAVCSVGGR